MNNGLVCSRCGHHDIEYRRGVQMYWCYRCLDWCAVVDNTGIRKLEQPLVISWETEDGQSGQDDYIATAKVEGRSDDSAEVLSVEYTTAQLPEERSTARRLLDSVI